MLEKCQRSPNQYVQRLIDRFRLYPDGQPYGAKLLDEIGDYMDWLILFLLCIILIFLGFLDCGYFCCVWRI